MAEQPSTAEPPIQLDALLPPKMARQAVAVGVTKASMDAWSTLVLAVLAGAFIALGAVAATVASINPGNVLPFGASRILTGIVFSLGLILVVVGGAELFTGNNLIVMAWASREVSTKALFRNWGLVFVGNFIGAVGTAVLVVLSGHHKLGQGAVGQAADAIAHAKLQYSFVEAMFLGILCNILVCLAVWLSYSARSTTDRVLAVVPPIATFVAAGFEHSIANMYFFSVVLLRNAIDGTAVSDPQLTWSGFLMHNLLPVTLGNILGGAGLVGAVYWFVYLRKEGGHATSP